MREPLPIDAFLETILGHVRQSRAVVVTAQPGAGKTTRLPPVLVDAGPVMVLQPRRVAVRSVAYRIAEERGWTIGREVGWQIRFERRFSAATKLLMVTEGVLAARLVRDPLLSEFRTVVFDEFHERSLNVDVGIALAKQAWLARNDLRLVVMSATIDTQAVSTFLAGCPVVDVPGRLFSVDVRYAPQRPVADVAVEGLATASGDVLCFLPGASEIRRAIEDLSARVRGEQIDVVPLYGALDADEQDRALRPDSTRRRVIVATNIAETSLTVPRITAVVDTGLHKVERYDVDRAVDSLELERITADAADQRAGRAGRVAPGIVWRLWDRRDRLRPHREPELHRVDLSGAVLGVLAWGGDPKQLEWFEPPRTEAIEAALRLLERLGAQRDGRLTELGHQIRRFPLHPRLACMLVASGGAREVARACALLSERHFLAPRHASTTSDLLSAIDDWSRMPAHVQRVAREVEDLAASALGSRAQERLTEEAFRRAILAGYPDRVAQRREPASPRVRLATGAGAVVGRESGVLDAEFLVAVDLHAAPTSWPLEQPARRATPEASIRVASRVERDWLQPNASMVEHRFDRDAGMVRAFRIERYDALVLAEHPVQPDHDVAAALLADAWISQGPRAEDEQLLRRLAFAEHPVETAGLVRRAASGFTSLEDVKLTRALEPDVLRALERNAPEMLTLPSGRRTRLEYGADGSVSAAVKLQELFGLAETPRIGPRQEPVLLALLAPNGRPVQLTRDLRSFWERAYFDVRKELRGRYPRHSWPDDPLNAVPTAKVKRR